MAERKPMAHASVFQCMLAAKERGVRRVVLGDVTEGDDAKENSIARFKRGFTETFETREHRLYRIRS